MKIPKKIPTFRIESIEDLEEAKVIMRQMADSMGLLHRFYRDEIFKVDDIEEGANVTGDHPGDVIFYAEEGSAPTHKAGRLWFDSTNKLLKRSTGSAWETVGDETALHQADVVIDNITDGTTYKKYTATEQTKLGTVEGSADVTGDHPQDIILYGAEAPGHAAGLLWFDSGNNLLKRSTGAAWQTVGDETALKEALTVASLSGLDADDLAESAAKKWAGETGADVTGEHEAATISGQGDLATIDEADADVLNMTNAPAEAGADVTIAHLAGSAVNVANAERSIFTSETPLSTPIRATAEMSNAQAFIGTYSLKLTATDDNSYIWLGSDYDYNVKIKPNKKWIFSCWVRSSVSGSNKVRMGTRASDTAFYSFYHNVASADTWERISVVFDLSANASEKVVLRAGNDGGNGAVIYFDGIMLEEQIGDNTTPSPFAFPAGVIDIDYVPEGSTNKFAAESGADVTSTHQAATIASQGNLATLNTVDTAQIDNNAVTISNFEYTAAEIDFSNAAEVVLQSIEIVCTGQPLAITYVSPAKKLTGGDAAYKFDLRLYRDAVKVYESELAMPVLSYMPLCTFVAKDEPDAGTYTYEVRIQGVHVLTGRVKDRALRIMEFKK